MRFFINAKTADSCNAIAAALSELNGDIVCCCTDTEAEAAELAEFDAVIVSTPLRTEFGLNFIAEARMRTEASMICIAKTEIADDVQNRIKFTGAYVLPRPFTKASLVQTVKMALLAGENMRRLSDENTELSRRLSDAKVINRAKCCLIQYLNFTEEQAQQHISRLAMDSRRTKREVAEDVLRTYANI